VLQDDVMSVAVHGWEILGGSVDGTVRRFDVRLGRVYTDELHHPVTCVQVSHDGLCLLAASLDR
jgi:mitogen-activated protein kinase organizer 1